MVETPRGEGGVLAFRALRFKIETIGERVYFRDQVHSRSKSDNPLAFRSFSDASSQAVALH